MMSKVLLHLMLLPYSSCEKMTTSLLIICMSFVMSADFTMFLKRGCTTSSVFGPYVMAFVGYVGPYGHYFGSMNERGIWEDIYSEAYMWTKVARTAVGHGKKLCLALKFNATCQSPFNPRSQERLLEVDRLETEVHVTLAIVDVNYVRPLFALFSRVCPSLMTDRYQVEILDHCKVSKKDGSSSNLCVRANAIARDLRRLRRLWSRTGDPKSRIEWSSNLHTTLSQTGRMWRVPPSVLAGVRFVSTMAPLLHRPISSPQHCLGAQRGLARANVANHAVNTVRDVFSTLELKGFTTGGRAKLQELAGSIIWQYWYEQQISVLPPLYLPYCCVNGQVCYLCDLDLHCKRRA